MGAPIEGSIAGSDALSSVFRHRRSAMRIGRLISLGSVVCGLALAVPQAGAVVAGREGWS